MPLWMNTMLFYLNDQCMLLEAWTGRLLSTATAGQTAVCLVSRQLVG